MVNIKNTNLSNQVLTSSTSHTFFFIIGSHGSSNVLVNVMLKMFLSASKPPMTSLDENVNRIVQQGNRRFGKGGESQLKVQQLCIFLSVFFFFFLLFFNVYVCWLERLLMCIRYFAIFRQNRLTSMSCFCEMCVKRLAMFHELRSVASLTVSLQSLPVTSSRNQVTWHTE